ncbi:MAG: AAA family ATPase [Actinomycetales bacterium]|nr:AAA family ATPase [Actinomycetales bacterium]
MTIVLVTGMSGTGKSTVLHELARRGHRVVDTDSDEWCEWVVDGVGAPDWVWREDRIAALLAAPTEGVLYIAGCKTNQGRFYEDVGAVVVLVAPAEVLLHRIADRDTNDYGKSRAERRLVLRHLAEVQPRLVASATAVVDATMPLDAVADALEAIADHVTGKGGLCSGTRPAVADGSSIA